MCMDGAGFLCALDVADTSTTQMANGKGSTYK